MHQSRLPCTAVAAFDLEEWNTELRTFLGNSGETMIAQEQKERKYDKSTHPARFEIIANNWQTILAILNEELPAAEKLGNVMDAIGISRDLNDLGVDRECARMTFKATKDIRDKYVLSRLAWDLGVLDELCERL